MISFYPAKLEEVMEEGDFNSVFESVCINGVEKGDVISHLKSISIMKALDHDDTLVGILSVVPSEPFEIEVHAYLLPKHRKRSRDVLEAFKEAIFTLTPFTSIKTSVTGDFKPLVRFLGFIGFRLVGVGRNKVHKGDKVYDMFYLKTDKENNYG